MEDKKDRELVEAYAHGSHRAFEVLYRRYRQRLYVYAYSLLRRLHEAEEALQEVFAKMVSNIGAFSRATNVSSFLFAVCRNHCLNMLQARKSTPQLSDEDGFELYQVHNPVDDAARREEIGRLNAVIGGLPDEQREVLVLKAFSELTFRQIAEATGEPQGTVATRYRLALEKIKGALQTQGRKCDE
jgi:RNA polymerase sigma-70 factor (ECF subfamily)